MGECVTCTKPTSEYLCPGCGDHLARDLADVPDLCAELDTTRYRLDHVTARAAVGRDAEKPLAWKEPAADAAWVLADTLGTWARDLAHVRHVPLDPRTVADVAGWLEHRIDWLRAHPDAAQAHDEISNAVRNTRRAIDLPANRARFHVGPCPEHVDEQRCPGEVWAYIPTRDDEDAMLRCQHDEQHAWGTVQWLRAGRRILTLMQQLKREQQREAA